MMENKLEQKKDYVNVCAIREKCEPESVCMTRLSCSVDSVVSLTDRGITGSADHHETGNTSNIPKSINVNHSNSKKKGECDSPAHTKASNNDRRRFLFQ